MDLRVQKTKKNIINAFLLLRSKKPLERITVKELCEEALINKTTFYAHYADMYELSEILEKETVRSILESVQNAENAFENPIRFTQALFHAMISQENLIHILFSGSRSGLLIQRIAEAVRESFFAARPEYRDDVKKNIVLTYEIYGAYYAFEEHRKYGDAQVVKILGELSSKLVDWLADEC